VERMRIKSSEQATVLDFTSRQSIDFLMPEPIFSDITPTTFKIRMRRPFANFGGTFERHVELRWLDDAIEWVDMMGYTIAAIDEISFRQPDNSWHSFTTEEIEETITRFLSGA